MSAREFLDNGGKVRMKIVGYRIEEYYTEPPTFSAFRIVKVGFFKTRADALCRGKLQSLEAAESRVASDVVQMRQKEVKSIWRRNAQGEWGGMF